MALWEFALEFDDGTALGQTALAEGADETEAADSAALAAARHSCLVVKRPGQTVPLDVEARWRELYGDAFPEIVPDTGRLALYARGIPNTTNARPPETYFVRHWRGELSLALSFWVNGGLVAGISMGMSLAVPLSATVGVVINITLVLVSVWSVIGIWRAAALYSGPRLWSMLALTLPPLALALALLRAALACAC